MARRFSWPLLLYSRYEYNIFLTFYRIKNSFLKSCVSYRKPRTVRTEQRKRARQMMIEKNERKKS